MVAVRQLLGHGNFPFLKRGAICAFILFLRLKKDVGVVHGPCRQILTRGKETILASLSDIPELLLGSTQRTHGLSRDVTDACRGRGTAGLIDIAPKPQQGHRASLSW